jgi:uncharacterized membrane protein YfcA
VDWPLIILFGFGVGIMVGTTGVGGGSLMTPLLILVFGTKPAIAIGTDLAYAAITKTVGGWRHFKAKTVDMKLSMWLAVGSVPGALGGVVVLDALEKAFGEQQFDDFILTAVACALLVTGIAVLWRALFINESRLRERPTIDPMDRRHKVAAIALGLSVGFVLGITSAGSGSLIAVGLIVAFRLNPRRVVGTDVFHAAILLWAAGIAHWIGGNVDFVLAGNILLGSVPGVIIGAALSDRAPQGFIRTALGLVLVGSGIVTIQKGDPGVWPIAAGIAAIGLGLVLYAPHWLHRRREAQRREESELERRQELDRAAALGRTLPAD